MKLIIGADLVPTQSNSVFFAEGQIEKVIDNKILDLLKSADYRMFNLEAPLTDVISPIEKAGPALIVPTNTICGIKKTGVDFVTLANNHILDQGEQGLVSTMNLLEKNEIAYAGVGTIDNANKVHFFNKDNIKIGVYCCCEHEFSIVDNNRMGANPFDPLESLDHIVNAKKECDHLIVLYHGGREHYRYPSPNLQKVCRKIIEKGASLVVCQHSHCVGCKEDYQNGTIVYGQGNFLFDLRDNEYWNTSLLLEVDVTKDKMFIKYHPLSKKANGVEFATDTSVIEGFITRSEEITTDGVIEQRYLELSKKTIDYFLSILNGNKLKNIFYKVLNKIFPTLYKKIVINKYYKKTKNSLINYFECEAHREIILYGLKNKNIYKY